MSGAAHHPVQTTAAASSAAPERQRCCDIPYSTWDSRAPQLAFDQYRRMPGRLAKAQDLCSSVGSTSKLGTACDYGRARSAQVYGELMCDQDRSAVTAEFMESHENGSPLRRELTHSNTNFNWGKKQTDAERV